MNKYLSLPIVGAVLLGCANPPLALEPAEPAPQNIRIAPDIGQEGVTTRTSRYVTESATPSRQIRDVLSTMIKVDIPVIAEPSIGEGMGFLLARTGIRVRVPLTYAESQLYQQPLPLVQTEMGYMSIRQGLQVMAGDVWQLEEDVVKRELGFTLKPMYAWNKTSNNPISATVSSQVQPVTSTVSLRDEHTGFSAHYPLSKTGVTAGTSHSVDTVRSATPQSDDFFPVISLHTVNRGESYRTAISRWMRADGIDDIAWAESDALLDALQMSPTSSFVHRGEVSESIAVLVNKVPELNSANLTVYINKSSKLAAIHPWPYRSVKVLRVSGSTLKQAISHLVGDYGWQWIDDGFQGQSWKLTQDYPFTSSYPLVAPAEDISMALSIVLRQYPVVAQVLDSAKQIYIVEDNR